MHAVRHSLAALLLLLVAGCSASAKEEAGQPEDVAEWTLEEVGRLGSVNEPETAFAMLGGVRIGPGGELFIGQPQQNQLWVFGADGTPLRRVGRGGQGPGEFEMMTGWGFLGDSLYVADLQLRRVSYFTPEGVFLTSRQWQSWEELPFAENRALLVDMPQVLLPDGSGLVTPGTSTTSRPGASRPSGLLTTTTPRVVFRVRLGDPALDTVFWREVTSTSTTVPVGQGSLLRVTCPFSTAPLVQPMTDGSGILVVERTVATGTEPAGAPLTLLSPSGDTVFSVALPYDPVPLDATRLAAAVERIRGIQLSNNRPAPSAGDVESALREMSCVPATLPPVQQLRSTQDGTIWLLLDDGSETPTIWEAIGRKGERLGRIHLRPSEMIAAAEGDVLVTTWTDELDVPYVTRYRLLR
jgi:hypothetical protein